MGDWLRSREVEVKDVTVRSWCADGRTIPDRYWVHVKSLADEKGVACSFEALAHSVAVGLIDNLMGQPSTGEDHSASATKSDENICEHREADSRGPFSGASVPTCSPTSEPSSASLASPACSAGEAEAA